MDWHPIGTAPKDGTLILIYRGNPGGNAPYSVCRWNEEDGWTEDAGDGFAESWSGYNWQVTHWAPLHAPAAIDPEKTYPN